MANLLTITKEADGYFTFVLNGDTANAIKNIRNDLLTVGNSAHFKTSNGANLIKEQDVLFSNVTIVDGVTSVVPTSVDDLFNELDNVGFFDWINGSGGSGGVNRFDELEDTFSYFGKDGQVVRVNESELKLETFVMPDVSYLSKFPTPLVAGKILKVNVGATDYELVDPPTGSSGLNQEFVYEIGETDPPVFELGTSAPLTAVAWNGIIMRKSDWTQEASQLTINFAPDPSQEHIFQPIGNV